jgi:hypothetical protein
MRRRTASVRSHSGFAPRSPAFMISGEVNLTRLGGRLTGTVAGSDVDLSLNDIYEGRAPGTIAGTPVTADREVGESETWGTDIPLRVDATYAGQQLLLVGWIHHDRDLGFDDTAIEGNLADQPVTGFISGGDPGDDTGTFAAHGVVRQQRLLRARPRAMRVRTPPFKGRCLADQSTYAPKPG